MSVDELINKIIELHNKYVNKYLSEPDTILINEEDAYVLLCYTRQYNLNAPGLNEPKYAGAKIYGMNLTVAKHCEMQVYEEVKE